MNRILWALMAMLVTCCAWAAKVDKKMTITVNGVERSYWLYVPSTLKANAPLVFSLHGTSGACENKSPFKTTVADSKGCIVVYPQGESLYFPVFGGYATGWRSTGEMSEDIDFFKAIIEEVASKYTINRQRIYCCGFSNGGMMTYTVANLCSDVFAAFASISGFPLNEFHLHHTGARPVPFLHIHGKADDFVRYALMPSIVDNMVARNGCNPVPEQKTVSGKYTKSVYAATEGGFPYIYYEIDGMGHNDYTSNTENSNSALTMWNFFNQYTLDSPCDTTMKWRPLVEAEGWAPKSHGWTLNTSTTLMTFGKDQKTDANQNVYRSLQLDNGHYKLKFKSQGTGTNIRVKLQKLTGTKTVVLSDTVRVGDDVVLFFNITDGWGEYKFTLFRTKTTDAITVTDLGIYTTTDEEEAEIRAGLTIMQPAQSALPQSVWTLSGQQMPRDRARATQRGVQVVRFSDGSVRKVLSE